MSGVVEAIFIAAQGGQDMHRVNEALAVVDAGLEGDRYARRVGYWSGVDECQATMIEAEGLDQITASSGLSVKNGEHRRNIVTRGVQLLELRGKTFRVGAAVFAFDRPRPPCRYIESLTNQPGITRALTGGRGGICVRVVEAGLIRVGDLIDVVEK